MDARQHIKINFHNNPPEDYGVYSLQNVFNSIIERILKYSSSCDVRLTLLYASEADGFISALYLSGIINADESGRLRDLVLDASEIDYFRSSSPAPENQISELPA